jgi:hypothetical protein
VLQGAAKGEIVAMQGWGGRYEREEEMKKMDSTSLFARSQEPVPRMKTTLASLQGCFTNGSLR